MGKISPISGKYIVHATINIDGVVEKPDVIGAIFGQTEGLLGSDLELRELQRSGRIGRIEVNTTVKSGKVNGDITIPSSLDKSETVIIAAAMEIIERIGPCNAKIRVQKIEDVRVSKRTQVVERAKELLRSLMDNVIPDSQEIAEEVSASVRVMEITSYGSEKLPAGPGVFDNEEVIIVEGRADVLTLLKYGFKNAIAMNGSSVPKSIIEICKEKTVTVFVDGDRGGDLNVKELLNVCEIDHVTRAPDGKEVEELTQKEIHKALRSRVSPEQAKSDVSARESKPNYGSRGRVARPNTRERSDKFDRNSRGRERTPSGRDDRNSRGSKNDRYERRDNKFSAPSPSLSDSEKDAFKASIDELLGSKGAALLDENSNILGKVPISELDSTLKSLKGSVYAVALDGAINSSLTKICEQTKVKFVVGMKADSDSKASRVTVLTPKDL